MTTAPRRSNALAGLLRKEAFHILRDRRTLVVITLIPILQVIIFGAAIRTDVEHIRLAIVDPAPDAITLGLRGRFAATDTFQIVHVASVSSAVDPLFQRGEAQAAILFEPGFATRLGQGLPAHVQIIADATEPNTGSSIQAYALQVIQGFERELQSGSGMPELKLGPTYGMPTYGMPTSGIRGQPVRIVPQVRTRFNPTRESSNLFVPGLMAFVLTIISSLMTAISLTREKETGTLETLLVSPLRPWQIIVGKVTPYLAIGFISVVGVIVEARLVFHVPLVGNLALLLAEGLLFILVSLSLGILISARTSSQRVAMFGAMLGTMLPTMLLSGFIFPLESLPWPLRALSNVVPARWFVTVARGIMLKGIGLEYLWRETAVLAGMALVLLALSTRSFKPRLE
jgi:ABC-2 type transport system permease protein